MSFFIISPAFTPTLRERSPTLMASDIFITLFAAFGTVISVFLSSLSLEGGLTLLNFSSLSNLLRLPKGPLFSYCFFLAGFSWAVIFISFQLFLLQGQQVSPQSFPYLPAVGRSCQPSSLLRVLFVLPALQPLLSLLLQRLFPSL